ELNQQILELASLLSLSEFAELHVVHAWRLAYESFLRSPHSGTSSIEVDVMLQEEEETRRGWLEALVDKHCSAQGEKAVSYLKPQLHLVNGDASVVVPALSDDLGAELVVMGTVGRAGVPGLLIGNTAENILNQIDCSVLTIKPAGFVSPVPLDE
ncbi:MAG: universal stress protein, partial [Pseudomonadales bacterium]